ncbi:hypothetical protein PPACK8108_LOCUS7575 [Phakopsora pachyrhizi]|uniref:Allantoicase domain-containing protein n=1 Tax=Phakopsora pachyrhizi TaxID=170000 RepID=A0AAV0AVV7_PHAPC|nr:hypothetical protein PPACK8108_LOCUS7575 [Phakopsora pachyrhizi]
MIDLIALLEHSDTLLVNTTNTWDQAQERRKKLIHRDGDHLVLLNILRAYESLQDSRRTAHNLQSELKEWSNKGYLDYVKIDTNYFIENFPQRIELYATNSNEIVPGTSNQWTKILAGEKLGPHQQQYFQLLEPGIVHTHVKMVIIPDGGVKQIRVMGSRFPIKQRFEIPKTRSTPQVKATTFRKISSQGVNLDSVTRLLILPLTCAAFTSYGCKPWDAEVLADGICQWTLKGLERHPFSSQTFTPLMVHKSGEGGIDDELRDHGLYLFVVELDDGNGKPDLKSLRAFVGKKSQGNEKADCELIEVNKILK